MTNSMKRKLRRLMDAINGALSDSDEITSSLDGVRREGYDLYLVLEAAVVLNRAGEDDIDDDDLQDGEDFEFEDDEDLSDDYDDLEDDDDLDDDDVEPPLEFRVMRKRRRGFVLSDQDVEFLKALRIRCDGS